MLRAYGVSDKGRIRPTNEDCFAVDEALGLCVIADGMGGHNAGEVAARLAVDAVVDFVRTRREAVRSFPPEGPLADSPETWPFGFDPARSGPQNLIRSAIQIANLQILEAALAADAFTGMGTTIVAALVDEDRLTVGHVGDSRLYVTRDGALRQLTQDDSWMAAVLEQNPQTDPGLYRYHPLRNALTNVVGARAGTEVHIVEEPLVGGELIVLSTDGVHGVLEAHRLEQLLSARDDLDGLARDLVEAALEGGSRDNCTAVVARLEMS